MSRPQWAPEWATPEQITDAEQAAAFSSPSPAQLSEMLRAAEMLAGGDARLEAGIRKALGRAWGLGWRSGVAWQDRPGGAGRLTFREGV